MRYIWRAGNPTSTPHHQPQFGHIYLHGGTLCRTHCRHHILLIGYYSPSSSHLPSWWNTLPHPLRRSGTRHRPGYKSVRWSTLCRCLTGPWFASTSECKRYCTRSMCPHNPRRADTRRCLRCRRVRQGRLCRCRIGPRFVSTSDCSPPYTHPTSRRSLHLEQRKRHRLGCRLVRRGRLCRCPIGPWFSPIFAYMRHCMRPM